MKRKRRNHSASFKAKVAVAAIVGTRRWQSYPSSLMCIRTRSRIGGGSCWIKRIRSLAWGCFTVRVGTQGQGATCQDRAIDDGTGFFRTRAGKDSRPERQKMIDRTHSLPVTRQCQLLSLNRSSVYYQPIGVSDEDLRLMRLIDEIHLKRPFYGSRRIRDNLQDLGHPVNRKKVQRLMQPDGDFCPVSEGQYQSAG